MLMGTFRNSENSQTPALCIAMQNAMYHAGLVWAVKKETDKPRMNSRDVELMSTAPANNSGGHANNDAYRKYKQDDAEMSL
jgi:hypothetical protein